MHRLQHSTLGPSAASVVALLLVLYIGLACASTAHAQKISQAISVAMVPFVDDTGHNSLLIANKATDAVAMALDDSQEYVVTAGGDTEREMEALGIIKAESPRFSVSKEQQVRLGERLRVEKVASGSVNMLRVYRNGACHCVMTVLLLDVATREWLDGATEPYTTQPMPGWKGEEAEVINEALRCAAEKAVARIQTDRRPRGNVDMVDQSGEVIINLGYRDGMEMGMELLVVRGVWNAAQERVVLRNLGVIEVRKTEINMSRCRLVSGSLPRTSDKCYVMYRPNVRIAKAARSVRTKRYATWLTAALLLTGIYNTARGPDYQSAPGVRAYLSQSAPGAEPRIRVIETSGNVPDATVTKAFLVFRGDYQGFPAEVDNQNFLIAARQGGRLDFFEDYPEQVVDIEFEMEFTYIDEEGEQEDGDVDITYNHLALVAGRQYYYKLRRIVDPGRVNIPIADTGQAPDVPVDVDFEIDPSDALGEPSPPAGPVTFFYPGTLETPSDGNEAVDWRKDSTTFTWRPAVGANQYRVLIYKNPQATGIAAKMSPVLNYTSGTTMSWKLDSNLQATTTYYWFVASWCNGEAKPVVQSNGSKGWILSQPFRFRTVSSPPPTPSSAAQESGGRRPPSRSGWWGGPRGRGK